MKGLSNVFGNVFRRWRDTVIKEIEFIKELVIQLCHNFRDMLLYFSKIHQHPGSVEGFPGQANLDLPVVSVHVFTFLAYHLKLMGCCKMGDNF